MEHPLDAAQADGEVALVGTAEDADPVVSEVRPPRGYPSENLKPNSGNLKPDLLLLRLLGLLRFLTSGRLPLNHRPSKP